jgi:paraquat-inducible protein B
MQRSKLMTKQDSAAEPMPHAVVMKRKSRFSLVWLVPVVAALIGGWLVVKAMTDKGPEITIYFTSAESLEAGKTKVKYKDVEIGQVTQIAFDKDFARVGVTVLLDKDAGRLVTTNTRFWVVRARVSMAAVSGLGTMFSGAYITLDPGAQGSPKQIFTGLEEPPIITSGMPGKHFVLESPTRGSLDVGAPLYYRQNRAGEVEAVSLAEDGSKVILKIFVHAPYDKYVLANTRFWNASGFDFKVDATGLSVNTESVVSILFGGIAFDTVESLGGPGEPAAESANFPLYESRTKAQERVYTVRRLWLMNFDEQVGGLNRGSPVLFKGIQVGQVLDVNLKFDSSKRTFNIPVLIAMEPERFNPTGPVPTEETFRNLVEYLVQKGMRAQLVTANFLTGQQAISLDFFPATPPVRIKWDGPYAEFPTTPGQFEQMGNRVNQLVARLEKIPVEQIAANLRDTLEGTKRVANSPEILKTVKSLDAAVKEMQALTHELRTKTSPELTASMQQARVSLAAAAAALESDSPLQSRMKMTLDEVSSTARSLRVLADYLERYPQSLLVGKDAPR